MGLFISFLSADCITSQIIILNNRQSLWISHYVAKINFEIPQVQLVGVTWAEVAVAKLGNRYGSLGPLFCFYLFCRGSLGCVGWMSWLRATHVVYTRSVEAESEELSLAARQIWSWRYFHQFCWQWMDISPLTYIFAKIPNKHVLKKVFPTCFCYQYGEAGECKELFIGIIDVYRTRFFTRILIITYSYLALLSVETVPKSWNIRSSLSHHIALLPCFLSYGACPQNLGIISIQYQPKWVISSLAWIGSILLDVSISMYAHSDFQYVKNSCWLRESLVIFSHGLSKRATGNLHQLY
jgi:hypothetical protein